MRSCLIPKFLVSCRHYRLTVSCYIMLFYPPSTTGIPAVMLDPVGELLTAMDVFKQHLLCAINNIAFYNRYQHKS